MQIRQLSVTHPEGLHARACARVVSLASRFRCNVSVVAAGRRASARSIVAMMMLAAAFGSTVTVEVDGPDEIAAMAAIVQLFDTGLQPPR